jgi:hypothetical protein
MIPSIKDGGKHEEARQDESLESGSEEEKCQKLFKKV